MPTFGKMASPSILVLVLLTSGSNVERCSCKLQAGVPFCVMPIVIFLNTDEIIVSLINGCMVDHVTITKHVSQAVCVCYLQVNI